MHETFLQQAIQLAADNVDSGEGGPYGAVIVKDDIVIAASANKVTSAIDPTAHAEIMAIRLACQNLNDFKLSGCVLYTSCEPCPMCLGAIYWARLARVFYACSRFDAKAANFDDSFIYDEINLPPERRHITMQHMHFANALEPFTLWNNKESKITY
jgi:guanine deaminase